VNVIVIVDCSTEAHPYKPFGACETCALDDCPHAQKIVDAMDVDPDQEWWDEHHRTCSRCNGSEYTWWAAQRAKEAGYQ